MKQKIIFAFLFSIFLFSLTSAFTNIELNQMGCSTFELGKEGIIGTEIPNQIPYKNEVFNVYLSEEFFGFIVLEESKIVNIGCSENENETYKIYIKDMNTIKDIAVAEENSTIIIQEKLKNGEIQIKGASLGKKIKWTFTKLLFNWFA